MLVNEFFDKYNNHGIDFDGYFGYQCMDLAEQYNKEVVGAPKLGGNAIDVWNNFPNTYYDKIENTPTGIPSKGDIVIWGQGVGQFGHIAVFSVGNQNQFTSFDQNWPINSICHFQVHNYNNVLGWLHPKRDVVTQPTIEKPLESQPEVIQPSVQTPETISTPPITTPSINIQAYNKTIVTFVVGIIVLLETHYGLQLTPDMQATLTTLITAIAVYMVPNKA